MEFKDYYKILDISNTATLSEIKIAFKKQAKKWHPDRNLGVDTTKKMQDINEAYLFLKDYEARERYDKEYLRYKEFTSRNSKSYSQEKKSKSYSQSKNKQKAERPNYEFDDEILKNWMRNARKQAVELAKQTIREVGELSVTATKAAGAKMIELIIAYSIVGFIFLILIKACSN